MPMHAAPVLLEEEAGVGFDSDEMAADLVGEVKDQVRVVAEQARLMECREFRGLPAAVPSQPQDIE